MFTLIQTSLNIVDHIMKCLTLLTNNLNLISNINQSSVFKNEGLSLLVLTNVETGDSAKDIDELVLRIHSIIERSNLNNIVAKTLIEQVVILPFAHLSEFSNPQINEVVYNLDQFRTRLATKYQTVLIPISSTKYLFSELAFIDTVITTKNNLSSNSLKNRMTTLLNIFSKKTILRSLYDEQKKEL